MADVALGRASLADLAAVTGHRRQAARKRWPALGEVYRRRKWLGDHLAEIVAVSRLLLDARDGLRPERSLAAGPGGDRDTRRWHALDELVHVTMRRTLRLAGPPRDDAADFAALGAAGTLAH